MLTDCDVKVSQNVVISGVRHAFIAANDVDVAGRLLAVGQATSRGTARVILRQASVMQVNGLAIEAPTVDLHGDHTMGAFCAEGNDVISRQAALYHLTGAAAVLVGSNVDVHGDFDGCTSFTATSSGPLIFRQASRILDCGAVTFRAGGLADLHGIVTGASAFRAEGSEVFFRQAAQISAAGRVDVAAAGGVFNWYGTVSSGGNVLISAGDDFILRDAGTIDANGDVSLLVTGDLGASAHRAAGNHNVVAR